ncbi:TetR/AcrR family transcriptional regulator [Flammeovirga aprica]|uniref:TetR/AcrR family transcriptional regulator n=1 Tax=Flammeovirga aprica JL-4 TaxID=694437 RepID=A0A7X9RT19_9BACT|nr:TetR/AcrR family transcriptional regulator [Flammeovirga aprica]NME67935.1 TetR/AcrR family transcriptional regulator [Flammeovirga aprica JL-4]
MKSLDLFNEKGISNVSLRTISDDLGISIGNLQYHFKKREDIIEALYFQLAEKIDGILFLNENDLLDSFFKTSQQMITIMFEYHFFLLDFVTVLRNNLKIKQHYAVLSKQREKQFLMVVETMMQHNLFRKELLKNEYKTLFQRVEVISNFWFSSVLVQASSLTESVIEDYLLIISQSIFPYLTEKGKKRYIDYFPAQKLES